MQVEAKNRGESRRAFLKRAGIGLAAATAATLALRPVNSSQKPTTGLPGSGSIFEPRRKDLLRHWAGKLSRFRLR